MKTENLVAAIALFAEISPQCPAGRILIFMHIAENEGTSINDAVRAAKLPLPTVARSIAVLANDYGLVRVDVDTNDSRVRRCHLSPKGQSLLRSITQIARQ